MMKRFGLAFMSLAMLGALAACGNENVMPMPDGGTTLPDGFLTTTCSTVDDCSPTSWEIPKCNPVTKMCTYTPKVCSATGPCTVGMCDVTDDGACKQVPTAEGMACTTDSDEPGLCTAGTCSATPNCAGSFAPIVYCDPSTSSAEQSSNAPTSFGGGAPVVGSYACAPSEAGPEIAFDIRKETGVGDEDITVSLRLVNADGTEVADQTSVDLDLIILEDTCTAGAACMNPADGAAFKGVTAGTSAERVTFRAVDGKKYYAVVDGKDANQVHDFVVEVEACGRCQPTDANRLTCNMTMPVTINSSTADGAAVINEYMCGATGSKTTVAAAGKEVPFYFKTPNDAARNVTAKVTGATSEVKLLTMPMSFWGQCDPVECSSFTTSAAGTATLTFPTDPGFSDFKRYWVIVDASTTTDTTFGLEFSCSKSCEAPYNLKCGVTGNETNFVLNGTTVGRPTENTYWGPGAGPAGCDGLSALAGPEAVVVFKPTIAAGTQAYDLTLSSKMAGENLTLTVLDAGLTMTPACDPGSVCRANTPTVGAGFTGTRTTNGTTAAAGVRFTADKDHTYFIVVDSADTSGSTFDLKVAGVGGGGCPP